MAQSVKRPTSARSRSRGPWVRAPRQALCWQLRAWSPFQILCLPLSLPLPCSCSVSLCLKNKWTLKKFKKINSLVFVLDWVPQKQTLRQRFLSIITDTICFHSYVDPEKLNRNPWGRDIENKNTIYSCCLKGNLGALAKDWQKDMRLGKISYVNHNV